MRTTLRVISALLGLFIVAPIWYYLLYKILQTVNASELMWFLYWIYLPVAFLIQIIEKLVKDEIWT